MTITHKSNPVISKNNRMAKIFKNHLCLYCNNLRYWDWYFCSKRKFNLFDYFLAETIKTIWDYKYYFNNWEYSGNPFVAIYERLFEFIPKKPVKKCPFYEYTDRKYYWTKIIERETEQHGMQNMKTQLPLDIFFKIC